MTEECRGALGGHSWTYRDTKSVTVETDKRLARTHTEVVAIEQCSDCGEYQLVSLDEVPLVSRNRTEKDVDVVGTNSSRQRTYVDEDDIETIANIND